jgi:hypothetical protein
MVGVEISCEMFHRVEMRQLFFIAWSGVWIGFIPFVFVDTSPTWVLTYFIVSGADITIMLSTLGEKNVMLIEKMRTDLAEAEKKEKEMMA